MDFDLLLSFEKSKKKLIPGDMFILSPKQGIFCFGKVIMTNVESRDSFVKGMNLVYIYDCFSKNETIPDELEAYEILLVEIVNNRLWQQGYAKYISFSEVNEHDNNKDIGFWDIIRNEFVDIKGDAIGHTPKYKGIYGLGSYGAIGKEIHKVIVDRGL